MDLIFIITIIIMLLTLISDIDGIRLKQQLRATLITMTQTLV